MATSQWIHAGTVLKMNATNHPDNLGWQDKFKEFSFRSWNERSCRLANGLKALEPNSEIMIFSDMKLEESTNDEIRFPAGWWLDWEKIARR